MSKERFNLTKKVGRGMALGLSLISLGCAPGSGPTPGPNMEASGYKITQASENVLEIAAYNYLDRIKGLKVINEVCRVTAVEESLHFFVMLVSTYEGDCLSRIPDYIRQAR